MRIEMSNVTVRFPEHETGALRDVAISVDEGEQVALLGPSGAGKTTLMRVIVGAVRPDGGTVRIGGLDPFASRSEVTRIRRATGLVRQRDDLVLGLTARTNALMSTAPEWGVAEWVAVLRGRVPKRYAGRLGTLAGRHGILPNLPARVERLSGGQRQRVAIVRALLPHPRLLLADEPTSGLDPVTSAAAIEALRQADGATLVFTTHDLDIARRFPRIVALRDGEVVFDGSALEERDIEDIYAGSEYAGGERSA